MFSLYLTDGSASSKDAGRACPWNVAVYDVDEMGFYEAQDGHGSFA